MELILLRHGKAEDSNPLGDSARVLLEKGYQQSRQAGRLLQGADLLPNIVLTSPYARAQQTAEEFCKAAGIPGPVVQGWLSSGMDPETALEELVAFKDFGRVAIVGHEPDFSQLIQWSLSALGGSIEIKKGSLACLRIQPPFRQATLSYLIPPVCSARC
jgi:phosphohistidine phosphatase